VKPSPGYTFALPPSFYYDSLIVKASSSFCPPKIENIYEFPFLRWVKRVPFHKDRNEIVLSRQGSRRKESRCYFGIESAARTVSAELTVYNTLIEFMMRLRSRPESVADWPCCPDLRV
jgi:hypothetical protein